MAVPGVGKIRREQKKYRDSSQEEASQEETSAKNFSEALKEARAQQANTANTASANTAPAECHTITYGRDRRLTHFIYRTREYRS